MAGYLVSLNRTITALSNQEIADILRLYSSLDGIDKSPTKYSLKNKKTTLPGPWRASRKRSGSAPGQQAAERYLQTISFKYMCVAVCSCVINCIHIPFNGVCIYTFNILVIYVCKSVFVHLYVTYRGIYIFIYIHTRTHKTNTHIVCLQYTHNVGYIILSFRRLFMVHGQAAHRPDYTRVSECVALKLFKEFKEGRNRPKDPKGRTFPIPQAIVMTYGHIKQLIEDCQQILQSTNLVLVTINNTTVSSW